MKSKQVTLQRQAARAMKDAMHIGVDPLNTVIVQGACFAQPGAVRLIRSFEKRERNERRERIYSRSHAIDAWENVKLDDAE